MIVAAVSAQGQMNICNCKLLLLLFHCYVWALKVITFFQKNSTRLRLYVITRGCFMHLYLVHVFFSTLMCKLLKT